MSGTILRKAKGKVFSEAFLTKLLEQKPEAYGAAFVYQNALSVQVDENPTLETLKELQEAFQDHEMIIYLGPKGPDVDDMQPFIALRSSENEDDVYVAVAMTGDYSNFNNNQSSHTPAYKAYEHAVRPMLMELLEFAGSDLELTYKGMGKKLFADAMQNVAIKDTCIIFVCSNGEVKTFSNSTTGGEIEGGWASNLYGYKEGSYPDKKDDDTPKTMVDKIKSKIKIGGPGSTMTKIEPEATPTKVKIGDDKPAKTETTIPTKEEDQKFPDFTVPADWDKWNNNTRKGWMNANLGSMLEGWPNWKPGEKIQFTKNLKHIPVSSKIREALMKHPLAPDNLNKGKDTEPKHIKVEEKDKKPTPSEIVLGLASPKQREDFKKLFMESADVKALIGKSITLEELQAMEKKLPSFSEQAGMSLEESMGWTMQKEIEIAQQYRDLYLARLLALKIGWFKQHLASKKAATDKPAMTKITPTPSSTGPKIKVA